MPGRFEVEGPYFLTERTTATQAFYSRINGQCVLSWSRTDVPPFAECQVELGRDTFECQVKALKAALNANNVGTADAVVRGLCFPSSAEAGAVFLACATELLNVSFITPSKLRLYLQIHVQDAKAFLRAACALCDASNGFVEEWQRFRALPAWFPREKTILELCRTEHALSSVLSVESQHTVAAIFSRHLVETCDCSKEDLFSTDRPYCVFPATALLNDPVLVNVGLAHADPGVRMVIAAYFANTAGKNTNTPCWEKCRNILLNQLNSVGDCIPFPPDLFPSRYLGRHRYSIPSRGFFAGRSFAMCILGLLQMDKWRNVLGAYRIGSDRWHLNVPHKFRIVKHGPESRLGRQTSRGSSVSSIYSYTVLVPGDLRHGVGRSEITELVYFVGALGYMWRQAFSVGVHRICSAAQFDSDSSYADMCVCGVRSPISETSSLHNRLDTVAFLRGLTHAEAAYLHYKATQTLQPLPENTHLREVDGFCRMVNNETVTLDTVMHCVQQCGPRGVMLSNYNNPFDARPFNNFDQTFWGWSQPDMQRVCTGLYDLKDASGRKLFVVVRIPHRSGNAHLDANLSADNSCRWTVFLYNRQVTCVPLACFYVHAALLTLIKREEGFQSESGCITHRDVSHLMAIAAVFCGRSNSAKTLFEKLLAGFFRLSGHNRNCGACEKTVANFAVGCADAGVLSLSLSAVASVCGHAPLKGLVRERVVHRLQTDSSIAHARLYANVWRTLLRVGAQCDVSDDVVELVTKVAVTIACPPAIYMDGLILNAILLTKQSSEDVFAILDKK